MGDFIKGAEILKIYVCVPRIESIWKVGKVITAYNEARARGTVAVDSSGR